MKDLPYIRPHPRDRASSYTVTLLDLAIFAAMGSLVGASKTEWAAPAMGTVIRCMNEHCERYPELEAMGGPPA